MIAASRWQRREGPLAPHLNVGRAAGRGRAALFFCSLSMSVVGPAGRLDSGLFGDDLLAGH